MTFLLCNEYKTKTKRMKYKTRLNQSMHEFLLFNIAFTKTKKKLINEYK